MQDKTEKFSVSFPGSVLEAVDGHVGKGGRSSYLAGLAKKDLEAKGVLAADPVEAELSRTRELIEARGLDAVKAAHDELAQEAAAAEASR